LQERTRAEYEEKKKLAQTQAEIKSQVARYHDELARKRLQSEHEAQRMRNQELVKMQEESALRIEQIRSKFEEEIQELRRRTDRERAAIEQETERLKKRADAEAKALEAKLSFEVNRRMLIEQANAEREKWVQAINTTFEHIGGMPYQVAISTCLLNKHVNFLDLF
jgi:ATPase family AAA domain-containing protein 3A/B